MVVEVRGQVVHHSRKQGQHLGMAFKASHKEV